MVLWIITVTDVDLNKGVPNAEVYLFTGGGGVEPPENADYSKITDATGATHFDVPRTFYRVGIIAKGYESAHDPHNPPEEWKDIWTCWGAGGAGYDYDFLVKYVAPPVCHNNPNLRAVYEMAEKNGLINMMAICKSLCEILTPTTKIRYRRS